MAREGKYGERKHIISSEKKKEEKKGRCHLIHRKKRPKETAHHFLLKGGRERESKQSKEVLETCRRWYVKGVPTVPPGGNGMLGKGNVCRTKGNGLCRGKGLRNGEKRRVNVEKGNCDSTGKGRNAEVDPQGAFSRNKVVVSINSTDVQRSRSGGRYQKCCPFRRIREGR